MSENSENRDDLMKDFLSRLGVKNKKEKPKSKVLKKDGEEAEVKVPIASQLPPEPKRGRPPKGSTKGASMPNDLTGAQIIGMPPARPEDQVIHNEGNKK